MAFPARTRLAAFAGHLAAGASRLAGAGGGSVIGGRLTLAIDPRALEIMAAERRVALVSGTNGKTTTTRLMAAGVSAAGHVSTNSAGANLLPGLVSALSHAALGGFAVLEVDEGLLSKAVDAIKPDAVVLLNLSRDQLDRIGEVRLHAERWRRMLESSPATAAVGNADDPLVAWAALGAHRTTWVAAGHRWRADAAACPACGSRIQWSGETAAGGPWACSSCDLQRPQPDLMLEGDQLVLNDGRRVVIHLKLPGWVNLANAAMAAAGAAALGVDPTLAVPKMSDVQAVAGRYEVIPVDGASVRLLLAKNPAGWAEALDVIRPAPAPVVIGINARIADGRDPSWLWDVPFERLAGRHVVATGDRGRDLAVRLTYAGVDHEFVPGYRQAVKAAARHARELDLAANYTSFQDARKELARGS